jgi:sulfate/thiosulfate transport system ATP-binding protein
LGDRIAVLNVGRLEQIGTPHEVYTNPETEYVATFLGAANLLLGVVSEGNIEIGTAKIPAHAECSRFRDGQSVKLVFRPEDVVLSTTGRLPNGCRRLSNGVIEELHFVGAFERMILRLDLVSRRVAEGDPPLYEVTINTPDRMSGVPVIVTNPKTDPNSEPRKVGERVAIGLRSFTVLPNFTLATERSGRLLSAAQAQG